METNITALITPTHTTEREDMILALMSDPCIARFDYKKCPYLLTNFLKLGFGYNLCKPNSDTASLADMCRNIAGGNCEFLRLKSKLLLRSTGFGSHTTHGSESSLHSLFGEGFTLGWWIRKNRAKLWGVCFIAITDCCGSRFILSHDGSNAVILRLQM
jgi:hypothetical protein